MKGGKVIASGGFGCVFKPSLKCKNGKNYKGVTKLMFKKHAKKEYLEINKIKGIVKKLKKYKDYFLIDDIKLCDINELTNDDLIGLDNCSCLKKYGIDTENINLNLNNFSGLQIPYGGLDIQSYLELYNENKDLIKINILLIKLLKNAIIPMNKLKLYHFDIKSGNVLYKNDSIKLIDWGLSDTQKSKEIINAAKRRPFQFNSPFSIILFHEDFNKWYLNKLKNKNNLYDIVNNWITYNNEDGGKGHYSLIKSLIYKYRNKKMENKIKKKFKKKINKNDYSKNVIIYNLVTILEKYTNKKTLVFDDNKYFNEIFKKNVDIWGFIMIYKPYTYSDNTELNEHIGCLINNYLYDNIYSTIPINIKKLIDDLTKINTILNNNIFVSNFSTKSIKALYKSKKKEISILKINDIDIIKSIISKKRSSKKRSSKKRSSKKRRSNKRSSKKRRSKKRSSKKRKLREKTKKSK